jgi:hypothetical protein
LPEPEPQVRHTCEKRNALRMIYDSKSHDFTKTLALRAGPVFIYRNRQRQQVPFLLPTVCLPERGSPRGFWEA